jgi:hypothetical protein
VHLILYSKSGCCLCAALAEKLQQIVSDPQGLSLTLEVRDIDSDRQWQEQFAYSVPVLRRKVGDQEQNLPRISPQTSVQKLRTLIQNFA